MGGRLTFFLVVCAACSLPHFASADPILTATSSDLGGGLVAYDLFFDGNDGQNASAAVDLKFEGAIQQVPGPFGLPQLHLGDVETLSSVGLNPPGPDLVYDSYFFSGSSPSTGLPAENGGAPTWGLDLPTGIDNPNGAAGGPSGTNTSGDPMWLSVGTTGGFAGEVIQIAHIVVDSLADTPFAGNLCVTGRIARGGFVFEQNGEMCIVPEPSTFLMLAVGAVVLAGLGWRRRGR